LGLKNYFIKHSFKNTVLSDFVNELAAAAKQLNIVESELVMVKWADEWLKSAGCAEISISYGADSEGKLTSFKVVQTPFNLAKTPENRLRL
jgi:aminopeptidase N